MFDLYFWFAAFWFMTIAVGILAEIWRKQSIEARRADEHIKACTDPNYFKTREQVLEEEVARLQEENARLAVKANQREFR